MRLAGSLLSALLTSCMGSLLQVLLSILSPACCRSIRGVGGPGDIPTPILTFPLVPGNDSAYDRQWAHEWAFAIGWFLTWLYILASLLFIPALFVLAVFLAWWIFSAKTMAQERQHCYIKRVFENGKVPDVPEKKKDAPYLERTLSSF